jgi:hypothetical protein
VPLSSPEIFCPDEKIVKLLNERKIEIPKGITSKNGKPLKWFKFSHKISCIHIKATGTIYYIAPNASCPELKFQTFMNTCVLDSLMCGVYHAEGE